MDTSTLIILVVIGVAAGILSGFVGIGGGVIIVPALVYVLGMSQHGAQGTSLFLMLPPIGALAVYNYYKAGSINIWYGVVIAICFVVGGYIGSKISLKMNPSWVKLIFGILMVYVAFRMVWTGMKEIYGK